jgi:putative membrane-bound dehydrogenase-like protein
MGHFLSWFLLLGQAAAPQDVPFPVSLDKRLSIECIASEPDIRTPTGIAVDGSGRIWAVENNTHFRPKNYIGHPSDRILIFEDFGPDGRARKITTFADGFKNSMGLALGKDGRVYFCTRSEISVFGATRRDDIAVDRTVLARLNSKGDYPHNGLSGFAFDAAGNVYFGQGENSGEPYTLVGSDGITLSGAGEGGNVYRCRPDGSGLVRLATGFWNPFDLCVDAFGRLFIEDNDPDSRPPCRLVHVVQGGDYGFKFRNGRRGLHPFTAWNGELPGTLPMVSGTGEAPCGMVAYESDGLPEEYRGTLIGSSWGDHVIQRFRLAPRGASFSSAPETVVEGTDSFRPVGMAVAPDGSLVFSDWADKSYPVHGKGRIWRIRWKSPQPAFPHDPQDVRARLRTLWSSGASASAIDDSLADPAEEVRGEATRLLGGEDPRRLKIALGDPSKFVRMQAILGLGPKAALEPLLGILADPDPFLAGAVIEALGRPSHVKLLLDHALDKQMPTKARLGLIVAMRRSGEAYCQAVIPKLLEESDPALRRAAIQWVGEDQLQHYAAALEGAASRPPTTREVFEAFIAANDFLNAGARREMDQRGSETYLAKVIGDAQKPPALRALALRMLRIDHPSLTVAKLQSLLAEKDDALRLESVRALAAKTDDAAQETLRKVAGDDQATGGLRAEAVMGLARSAAQSASTRSLLISLLREGPLRSIAIQSLGGATDQKEVREALTALAHRPELEEKIALILNPAGVPRPKTVAEWRAILEEPGDAAAGERVFFHPRGPQCFVCHCVNGRGGEVGPDLSTIAAAINREKIVESILEPSKEIAPAYTNWQVLTVNGQVFDGRILSEDPPGTLSFVDPATGKETILLAALTLIDAKAQTRRIPLVQIQERRALKLSIMPENLHAVLTRQEFRDLVTYLGGLK